MTDDRGQRTEHAMTRRMTCIECPASCLLSADVENGRFVKVEGNKCPKGETYAASEVENPQRILTSTVMAKGLSLKMVPVRTDKPIPKLRLREGMDIVKKARIVSPVRAGDVIMAHFLGLDVNLVATRDAAG